MVSKSYQRQYLKAIEKKILLDISENAIGKTMASWNLIPELIKEVCHFNNFSI